MATAELVQKPPTTTTPGRSWTYGFGAFLVLAALMGVGLVAGGEPARFATTGLIFAPAIVLIGLLHLRSWRAARIASWILFWLVMLVTAAMVVGLISVSLTPRGSSEPTPEESTRLLLPGLVVVVLLLAAVVLTVTSLWLPLGRALGARLDGADAAHAQATVAVLLLSVLMVAPLALLGGRAPLLDLLSKTPTQDMGDPLLAQVYQTVWTVLLVLWGSAFPARIGLKATFDRLGLRSLGAPAIAPLAAIVVASVALGTGLDVLNRSVLGGLGWPLTDGSIVQRLIPAVGTPVGALLLAICAGSSEELLFRGLLQPRLGWLLPNIGFAAIHAFQYGLDGLVVVFALGTVLAIVRQRWNTTAAIGVHSSYDAALFFIAIIQGG